MTLIQFRQWLFVITDLIYFLPLPFAFCFWEGLNKGQKYLAFYFLLFFILNAISDIMVLIFELSNLYFGYLYSIIECVLIFLMYQSFYEDTRSRKINLSLFLLCFAILIFDLSIFTGFKNAENYISQIIISFYIVIISIYFISNSIIRNIKNDLFDELNVLIALSLLIKYFLKILYAFFNGVIYTTQRNYVIAQQIDNYYNFFSILTILMATWVYYRNYYQKKHFK